MVICNYFVNGHCRFGSKCVNDHIDLKALLKTEIESAINGKQWLLSCFGPFKESTVVPNLSDRSFEEVRLDFLEASKSGNAQQHVNELIAQYTEAMAKLNQLKLASPDTIQLISNIYNQSVTDQKTNQAANPSNNPSTNIFAVSNSTVASPPSQTQNPFQLSNVFGGNQSQQAPALNAGSIFGGAPANNNPFQTQNSIFGVSNEPQPPAPNFTYSMGQQTPQQSVFGMTPQSSPQPSIFGGTQPIQQQPPSIFGGQPSAFGSSSVFGAVPQQPQQASSIFASTVFSQQQPASTNIFSPPQQIAPQTGTFVQGSTNVFGFQSQPELSIQPNTGNIFAQPTPNLFSMQQEPIQQPSLPATAGNIFQIQQPSSNVQPFGANPFQTQPPPVDETAFSKPEELTPEEIQAFQAEAFQLGSIPLKPPPRHLCT